MIENVFLFPKTVQITKYEDIISPHVYQYINDRTNYDFDPATGIFISKDRNVLDLYLFSNLKTFLEFTANNYIKEMKIENVDVYITISWLNMHEHKQSHGFHRHTNSILSGVFYFDDSTPITFLDQDNNFIANKSYSFNVSENNHMNSQAFDMNTRKNTAVVFPSTLVHGVPPNNTNKTRISLAFNTYIRGTIGNKYNSTELILK